MNNEKFTTGQSTHEVLRIGDTVRRATGPHSPFVHRLLNLLEENDFKYSPRFLGMDEQGREIISYIDGEPINSDSNSLELAVESIKLLKKYHDITADSELSEDQEVVCHNDFSPWNTLIKDNKIVGIIDFDEAKPGKRVEDLAYAIWTFLDLGSDQDSGLQIRNLRKLTDRYGFTDIEALIEEILEQQRRILNKRTDMARNVKNVKVREFSEWKVFEIEKEMDWVKKNQAQIISS